MHTRAGRFQNCACKGKRGAFAIRAGDMNGFRKALVRPAERFKQAREPLQRQIDLAGMQRKQTREERIE